MFYLLATVFCTSLLSSLSAGEGLKRLMEGNDRYVHDKLEHPNRTSERREALVSKQEPFAVIVGCADSRVAPEILFDQGVGDLFVVRVAGNVIGPLEVESVEYAAVYLHSSIILVMGHENCGAVNAVVQGTTKDVEEIARLVQPSVDEAKKENSKDLLSSSIKKNAIHMKESLVKNPVLQKLMKEGKIEIQAAYYHLQTGAVEIL